MSPEAISSLPPSEPVPALGDRYRAISFLGRGGMGSVYEVEHAHTGERLALKLLQRVHVRDAKVVERFRREARVFAKLRSDYVVRIIDADFAAQMDNAP